MSTCLLKETMATGCCLRLKRQLSSVPNTFGYSEDALLFLVVRNIVQLFECWVLYLQHYMKLDVVTHACNSSTGEIGAGRSEFQAIYGYIASWREAWTNWDLVFKNQTKIFLYLNIDLFYYCMDQNKPKNLEEEFAFQVETCTSLYIAFRPAVWNLPG